MRDVKDVLAVAVGAVEPEDLALEPILRLATARRRRERLLAAALALVLTAGLAAGLAVALTRSGASAPATGEPIVGPTRVVLIPSTSMEPTLHPGDQVLVDEGAYSTTEPERGDVIAFTVQDRDLSPPGLIWIKRIVGLPGDVVKERRGRLFVNGEEFAMPSRGVAHDRQTMGPWRVAPRHLFVVGDNLANSNDSRFGLGLVSMNAVIGRVVWILGPDERVGGLRAPPASVAKPRPSHS